jgi:hypothetical protein
LSKPGDPLLVMVEAIEGREIGVVLDNFEDGIVAFRDDVAEFLCESAGKLGVWVAFGARFGVSGERAKMLNSGRQRHLREKC